MIRSLQKKLIATALLSLSVLLILLIGCIVTISYVEMERSADATLARLAQEEPQSPGPSEHRPFFGYQISLGAPIPFGHFIAKRDGMQVSSVDMRGLPTLTSEEALQLAQKALDTGAKEGKLGSYKYLVTETQVIFLDNTVQMRTLFTILVIACAVSLVCLALMLFLVWFFSRRLLRPIVVNLQKQRQFVTDAGHEIKTPLAIIQANTEALELHTGQTKWSAHIRAQVTRMDGLMQKLLLLAQADEELPLVFTCVNLSDLCQRAVELFTEPAIRRNLAMQVSVSPHIQLQGNGERLEQLLQILLDNAVKYASSPGTIWVTLQQEGRHIHLSVANTVTQLPDAPPDSLFDRFFRADTARTQSSGGYGIGLSVAKAICQMHHGKLSAVYEAPNRIRFTALF